jgi:hypothetical protein
VNCHAPPAEDQNAVVRDDRTIVDCVFARCINPLATRRGDEENDGKELSLREIRGKSTENIRADANNVSFAAMARLP